MHNLPTYCSASEMFTVADFKAVIRNLVHRFMTIFSLSACVYLYKFLLYSWQPWLFPPKYISNKREKRCCHFFCVVPE